MATAPAIQEKWMTLEAWLLTVEFLSLTPQMRGWARSYVQTFLETGSTDAFAATKAAYHCQNDEYTRVFAYQVQNKFKIILALNKFFGNSPSEIVSAMALKAFSKRSLTVAQAKALQLYAIASGVSESSIAQIAKAKIQKGPTKAEEEYKLEHQYEVGDVLTQRGVQYRVLTINEFGVPMEMEEVQ